MDDRHGAHETQSGSHILEWKTQELLCIISVRVSVTVPRAPKQMHQQNDSRLSLEEGDLYSAFQEGIAQLHVAGLTNRPGVVIVPLAMNCDTKLFPNSTQDGAVN